MTDFAGAAHTWPGQKILLIGCGNMGQALLAGWLNAGISAKLISIVDPGLDADKVDHRIPRANIFPTLEHCPGAGVAILAVKPSLIEDVCTGISAMPQTPQMVLSVAAGVSSATLAQHLPGVATIIRVMPNLPASVGHAATVCFHKGEPSEETRAVATILFSAVGAVFWVQNEDQMHAVTAVSGSGSAYIFLMMEAMATAARELGLPGSLAEKLAIETVKGAGLMAASRDVSPSQLRSQVSSPNGTTVAGLAPLLDPESGLFPLMNRSLSAAEQRSRELAYKPSDHSRKA